MMPAGRRRTFIWLSTEATTTPDGDGSFTPVPAALSPNGVWASVAPATTRTLERVMGGTVTTTESYLVTMPYHPGVTTATVLTMDGRTLRVTGVTHPDGRRGDTIALCVEQP